MSSSPEQKAAVTSFPLVQPGASDLAGLVAILRRLAIAQSLPEIMQITIQAARIILRADGITFVLREGDLCYYAAEDAISPLWIGRRFPLDACISGWCMIKGKAAVIPDIYQDPRIPQDAYRPTFVQSLAMVPVHLKNPIAAIGAYPELFMRLPERAVGAEQAFDIMCYLVVEPDQLPPTEFAPVTRQKARISADMRAKRYPS